MRAAPISFRVQSSNIDKNLFTEITPRSVFISLFLSFFLGILCSSLTVPPPAYPMMSSEGTAIYKIVTGAQPHPVEEFAARELQTCLKRMTGITFPIKSETEAQGLHLLIVGKCAVTERLELLMSPRFFLDDAFIVKRVGEMIILNGCTPRSTLFAVYRFLEFLGCRWYAPNFSFYRNWTGEYVPERAEIPLPDVSYRYDPAYRWRRMAPDFNGAADIRDSLEVINWAAKNRINVIDMSGESAGSQFRISPMMLREIRRRGLTISVNANQLFSLMLSPKQLEDHPEWLKLAGGYRMSLFPIKLDVTNPELNKAINPGVYGNFSPLSHISIIKMDELPAKKDEPLNELSLIQRLQPEIIFEVSTTADKAQSVLKDASTMHSIVDIICTPNSASHTFFPENIRKLLLRNMVNASHTAGLIFSDASDVSLCTIAKFSLDIVKCLKEARSWSIRSVCWSPRIETWGSRELEHYLTAASMSSVGLDLKEQIGEYGTIRFGGLPVSWREYFIVLSEIANLPAASQTIQFSSPEKNLLMEALNKKILDINIQANDTTDRYRHFFLKKHLMYLQYLKMKSILLDDSGPIILKEQIREKLNELYRNPDANGWIERLNLQAKTTMR